MEALTIWILATTAEITGTTIVLSAGGLAVATSITTFIVVTAASMAASKLLAPKMPSFSDSSMTDRSQMVRNPISARSIVYGKCRVSGTIVYLSTTGDKNQFLHIVVTLAGHEIQAIDEIYFNDELVPLDAVFTNEPTGFYAGVARVNKHLGETYQTVDEDLEDDTNSLTDGKWTEHHRLRGIAYLYVRLTWDAEKYPSGIPNISAVIRGKKVLDPRTGNTGYSANAALCLRDYLTDTALGMGMTAAEVDDTAFGVAATICEEQVQILPLSPTVYENRYEANGVIVTSASPDENIGKLLSAMGGLIAYTGGRIVPYASAYRIPTVTLTEKHFVGPLNVQTRTSARDRVNSVKGVYVSETNNWQVTDFPTISSATYVTADNNTVFFRDVVLPFTTSPSCAQRLAVLELRRAREEITFSARFRLEAMQVRAGDTVMITNEKLGWSSKVFEVMEWNFASDGTPPQVFIDMTLRETASSVYSWDVDEEIFVEDSPNTTLPDPFTLGAPTNLSLTADGTTQLVQADGTILPRIRVGWTPPAAEFIQSGGSVVIEYKPAASTTYLTWNTVEGAQTEDFISSDITIGTNYNVRIYGESFFGISTSYLSGSITVAKDTTAPAIPTGLSAAIGTGKAVSLDWNDNIEPDFSEYGIYRNTSAVTPANANTDKIAEVRASRFVDTDVNIGTTYYYWLTAYDSVENVSGFTSYVQATPSVITAGPIDPSAPATPNAPTLISTTVYVSTDGTSFARVSLTAPPLPSGAVALDVLYRRTGSSDFIIGNQINSSVSYAVTIDDLSVGEAYQFAARGISFSGALSPISSLLSQAAPSNTILPTAPTASFIDGQFAPPVSQGKIPMFAIGMTITASASTDIARVQSKVAVTNDPTDGAAWYADGNNSLFDQAMPANGSVRVAFYDVTGMTAGFGFARVISRSGIASNWTSLGSVQADSSLIKRPLGTVSQFNTDDVSTTGIKTGGGASTRQINVIFSESVVATLAGGAASETFETSLTNRGFSAKPDIGIAQCASDGNISAAYDFDAAGNSSVTAVIRVSTIDGSNIGAGNYRFSVEFTDFT
jgi:hypothetical protein